MDVRQCKECGRLFPYMGNALCPECLQEMDRKFVKVREYIYKNPDADIKEVAENTEVKEKHILNFLREERLSLGSATGALTCEVCGKPIITGRFCDGCKADLANVLDKKEEKKPEKEKIEEIPKQTARMHIDRLNPNRRRFER